MDRITVLLGLILVCTFGCSGGQNNTNDDAQHHYSLTVAVEHGTAAITPDLTSYAAGTRVTIEITPDDGYDFYVWSGDHTGMENPLVITMESDTTLTAACISEIYQNYCTEADQFSFDILSPAQSGGSVSTILRKISISGTVPAAASKIEYRIDSDPYIELTNRSYQNSCNWVQEINLTGGIKTYTIDFRATYGSGSTDVRTMTVDLQSPTTYYVDYETGDDSNSGTSIGTPWQHCPGDDEVTGNADITLAAGSVVIFKGGVKYHGEIYPDAGGESALMPIVYDGDSGTYASHWGTGKAIIDGSETLTGKWTQCDATVLPGHPSPADIWYTTAPDYYTEDERTLYEDDQFLWFSQYPKPGNRLDYDDPNYFLTVPAGNITRTSVTDPDVFDQSDSNHWQGASVVIYRSGNLTQAAKITGFDPDMDKVTFEDIGAAPMEMEGNNFYSLLFHKNFITQPGEYYYDASANRIYIWPIHSDDPSDHVYTVSKYAKGFFVMHSNIVISGFKIWKLFGKPKAYYDGCAINCLVNQGTLTNLVIENNDITMNRSFSGRGQIFVSDTDGALIQGNNIHHNNKTLSIHSARSNNVIVAENQIIQTRGAGIVFMPVESGQIIKNTIRELFGTHSNSIAIYLGSKDNLVAHNEVYDAPRPVTIQEGTNFCLFGNVFDSWRSGSTVADWGGCSGNVSIINNVVTGRPGSSHVLAASDEATYTVMNNILDGLSNARNQDIDIHDYNLYIGLAWNQGSSWTPGTGEIVDFVDQEDQIFVDFDNSDGIVDLHLLNNSPAIDAGSDPRDYLPYREFPLFDFNVDMDGNMMNSDGIWDIGAYSY